VKRTGTKSKDENLESADRDAASSKFAKSLKQFIEKPDKKKKIDESKLKKMKEEHQEKTRRREEKDARKKAA